MRLRWSLLFALAAAAVIPSAALAASGKPDASTDMTLWEFIRASGLVAFLLLSVSTALGVAVNVRALDTWMRRAWVYEMHQTLSVLALAMTGLHVVLLLANHHVPFSVGEILIPYTSRWKPLAIALGTVSLYLVAALIVTSSMRRTVGQKTWRLIHYGGFVGWAAAMVHGIAAGSDTGVPWVQYLYVTSGATVGFLTLFRILAPSARQAVESSRLTTR